MSFVFDLALREFLAQRVGGFSRLTPPPAHDALKRAAVVLAIAPDDRGRASILLTRRAATLRAHGGQWALPGGRCDDGETAREAALRELREELDLALAPGDILGELDDYPTRSGYAIAPLVVWAGDAPRLAPNPAEVASVHHIALDELSRPGAVEFLTIPESDRPVIRLHFGDSQVHAPTAAPIYQLTELMAGRVTRVHELEQPVFAWK